ncbi:MAG TPA: ImmA/IrrE family metallo-endopeptidase [Clostridiales bacterium]|nr:ImmA/IrrE family metallo-endopeptidase [Clostridiales bacterium]
MLDAKYIYNKAMADVRNFGRQHPDLIAQSNGITWYEQANLGEVKGMYTRYLDTEYIIVNNLLEYYDWLQTGFHEDAHSIFHPEMATIPLKDLDMLNYIDTLEYEANAYMAHILLPDKDIMFYISQGFTVEQIASVMKVTPQTVEIKINELKRMNFSFPEQINFA